jgi:hypothetical protein
MIFSLNVIVKSNKIPHLISILFTIPVRSYLWILISSFYLTIKWLDAFGIFNLLKWFHKNVSLFIKIVSQIQNNQCLNDCLYTLFYSLKLLLVS